MNFLVAKVVITGSFILHGTGNRNGTGTLNEGFIYYALTVLTVPRLGMGQEWHRVPMGCIPFLVHNPSPIPIPGPVQCV